jgi:hypothetical protein
VALLDPQGRPRAGLPHRARAKHSASHPVHVTVRARAGLPSLRGDALLQNALRDAIAPGHKSSFRVTPRETRNALLYVLQNWAKHGKYPGYDPASSAPWFDGWSTPPPQRDEPQIVARPRTWLVTVGWRRHGPQAGARLRGRPIERSLTDRPQPWAETR